MERSDLWKRDILRFGIVGANRTLLSGSLEIRRVACMKIVVVGMKKAGSEGKSPA